MYYFRRRYFVQKNCITNFLLIIICFDGGGKKPYAFSWNFSNIPYTSEQLYPCFKSLNDICIYKKNIKK